MDIASILIIIGVIYGVLWFFDNFFKTCAHYPYIKFLEGTGFQIGFLSIKWKTKAFNRMIIRWGTSRPNFLNLWFTMGLYTTLVLLPLSVFLLLFELFKNFSTSSGETNPIVQPAIPGVNLPASELCYYSLTLILCSVVHELGHALAAVLEDVYIMDVGANVFFILPIAYVNLSTDKFSTLTRKRVLKIICAGIWHNLVLTFTAYLLFISLPFLFSPFYHISKGVTVTNMAKYSPLSGVKGLIVGDTISKINEYTIYDESSWEECLRNLDGRKTAFCIDSNWISKFDKSIPLRHLENDNFDCCDSTKSDHYVCFEYLDNANGVLELLTHTCLPTRLTIDTSINFCSSDPYRCPNNEHCFRPILANNTNLFKIIRKGKNVIYLGLASDIARTVEISPYVPKSLFTTTYLPDITTKFLKYTAVLSLGLAIVNVIPFWYMDGQHIADALGMIFLRKKLGKSGTRLIIVLVTWLFTFLLTTHCVIVIWRNLL